MQFRKRDTEFCYSNDHRAVTFRAIVPLIVTFMSASSSKKIKEDKNTSVQSEMKISRLDSIPSILSTKHHDLSTSCPLSSRRNDSVTTVEYVPRIKNSFSTKGFTAVTCNYGFKRTGSTALNARYERNDIRDLLLD